MTEDVLPDLAKARFFTLCDVKNGHVLTPNGLKPDPKKVKAIIDFETPRDFAGVQRFLGLVIYLSKFMSHLSVMSEPIRSLVHTDIVWQWTHKH